MDYYNKELLELAIKLEDITNSLNAIIEEIREREESEWDDYTVHEAASSLYISEESILQEYSPFMKDGELHVRIHAHTFIQNETEY